jgi:hypothetical protein
MAYSSIAKPTDYFNTVLYTGNGGSSRGITGVGFQPDWLWLKARSKANSHILIDVVRGANRVRSDSTAAEASVSGEFISFDTDGFTVTENASNEMNNNSTTYAAWNWLGANGSASNSDGGTSSTVSVNTTAGLSIVGWAGAGSATTVGHGLGVAPKVVLVKNRSEVYGWQMYHESLGNGKYVSLNSTDAVATSSQSWNDTSPTSSVFSVGASDSNNKSGNNIIAYCFAEKQGYSKFGSYTGNGNADGTFVYTGFKSAWVMVKNTAISSAWVLSDNKRETFNPVEKFLRPDTSDAEVTGDSSGWTIDMLSNGFKLRSTGNGVNGSGNSIIYMAFAENPFVGNDSGTAVPVTAR